MGACAQDEFTLVHKQPTFPEVDLEGQQMRVDLVPHQVLQGRQELDRLFQGILYLQTVHRTLVWNGPALRFRVAMVSKKSIHCTWTAFIQRFSVQWPLKALYNSALFQHYPDSLRDTSTL